MKYEYWKAQNGNWYWHLKTSNGEKIAQSRLQTKQNCLSSNKLVKSSAEASEVNLTPPTASTDPAMPVSATKPSRSRGARWKKVWKGFLRFVKSKWPGLSTAFGLGCSLTFFFMQAYFVPSEKLSLHDDNAELKKTNKDLAGGIALRDERIRQLTVPEPQPLTWREIEEGYAKRDGRAAEQTSFIGRYIGKEVDWEIVLQYMISESWHFSYWENGSRFASQALFDANFEENSPASSLKPGDRIRVKGTLAPFSEKQLKINDATYEFLEPGPKPK